MLFYYNYNEQECARSEKQQQLIIYVIFLQNAIARPGTLRLAGRPTEIFCLPEQLSIPLRRNLR
jgi:hypothetical protein